MPGFISYAVRNNLLQRRDKYRKKRPNLFSSFHSIFAETKRRPLSRTRRLGKTPPGRCSGGYLLI